MKWIEVTTTWKDSGDLTARITGIVESKQKPYKGMEIKEGYDLNFDYFRTRKQAEEFIRGT